MNLKNIALVSLLFASFIQSGTLKEKLQADIAQLKELETRCDNATEEARQEYIKLIEIYEQTKAAQNLAKTEKELDDCQKIYGLYAKECDQIRDRFYNEKRVAQQTLEFQVKEAARKNHWDRAIIHAQVLHKLGSLEYQLEQIN